MNQLEHAGLVHTDPADPEEAVTDSAAAATAFSTGVKTFNGAIGVDAAGRRSRRCSRTRAAPARRPGS
jgi:alkaline phosphatase